MKREKIPVDKLRIGMYVAELDRPWLGTAFAFQGFTITAASQIEQIRQYSEFVTVDSPPDRGQKDVRESTGPIAVRGRTHHPVVLSVEKETPRAKSIYAACQKTVGQMVQRLRSDGGLATAELKQSVGEIVESVLRNPDAMLLLAKLKTKGDYEFVRALDTSLLMITFGRFLQLERAQLDVLGMAGMLLDVGKIRIPDALLRKKDVISPEEYAILKRHVQYSVEIIRKEKDPQEEVISIVMQHHERQDGSGYPHGLRGAEVTLYGSIAGIVDTYSALASMRPYAEQLSPSNALARLYKVRGSLFHEALIEQFIQCIGIYPVGSVVELNTGEIGMVIAQNLVRRLQPRVMVILNADRTPLRPEKIIDLVKEPRATADEPYRIRRTLQAETLPVDLQSYFL